MEVKIGYVVVRAAPNQGFQTTFHCGGPAADAVRHRCVHRRPFATAVRAYHNARCSLLQTGVAVEG